MGKCSLSLVLHSRWEAKGQSTPDQVSISPKLPARCTKEHFDPLLESFDSPSAAGSFGSRCLPSEWNISCCHTAVCSGAVARTGCFGVHPWISPSWVPVHSWGVRRSQMGKIPPERQLCWEGLKLSFLLGRRLLGINQVWLWFFTRKSWKTGKKGFLAGDLCPSDTLPPFNITLVLKNKTLGYLKINIKWK